MAVDTEKILSYIGLARKAGKLASGEFMTEKMVKNKKAFLVIVAEDASENTKKMFTNMCEFYKVPICFLANKEILGHRLGKKLRASCAVTEKGLAEAILKNIE